MNRAKLAHEGRVLAVNRYNDELLGVAIDGPVLRVGGRELLVCEVRAQLALSLGDDNEVGTAGAGRRLNLPVPWREPLEAGGAWVYLAIETDDGGLVTLADYTPDARLARRFAENLKSAVGRPWPLRTPFGPPIEASRGAVWQSSQPAADDGSAASAVGEALLVALVAAALVYCAAPAAAPAVVAAFAAAFAARLWPLWRAGGSGDIGLQLDSAFPGWREQVGAWDRRLPEPAAQRQPSRW
jgi:hypothetical protein